MRKPLIVILALGLICQWPARPADALDSRNCWRKWRLTTTPEPRPRWPNWMTSSSALLDAARVRGIEARMDRVLESAATLAGKQVICRHLQGDRYGGFRAAAHEAARRAGNGGCGPLRLGGHAWSGCGPGLAQGAGPVGGQRQSGSHQHPGGARRCPRGARAGQAGLGFGPGSASAAVAALGKIGNAAANNLLARRARKAQGALRTQVLQSSLACATGWRSAAAGRPLSQSIRNWGGPSLPP